MKNMAGFKIMVETKSEVTHEYYFPLLKEALIFYNGIVRQGLKATIERISQP